MKSAIAIEKSDNAKIGTVSATYAAQQTCPKTCTLYNNGCYAEAGFVGIQTNKLNKTLETNVNTLAKLEAIEIKGLSGKLPLRIHVVGDCTTKFGARTLSNASKKFPVSWTYTHAWASVPRASWQQTSILASIENVEQIEPARKQGYTFAIIVDSHKTNKAYNIYKDYKVIPCPNQTKQITCTQCKLCWKSDWLYQNKIGIAFAAHGSQKKKVLISISI